jgi:hypothetical protein
MKNKYSILAVGALLAGIGAYFMAGAPTKTLPSLDMIATASGIADKSASEMPEKSASEMPDKTTANLALHKALYDFKLVSAKQGADVIGVAGKLYFEQDDVCDAWTSDHRLTVEYQYPERHAIRNTGHYVAWESKDGQKFSFSSERQENDEMTEQLRGSMERQAIGDSKAVYSRPDDLSFDLPNGFYLPTSHTLEIIRRAKAGEHFFSGVLFDGTDADGPFEAGTFIGKQATPEELKKIADSNPKIDAALLSPLAWHIRMAVFPLKNADSATPVYEMDMILHDNGVTSYSLVDYQSFTVEQKLSALEKLPTKPCR